MLTKIIMVIFISCTKCVGDEFVSIVDPKVLSIPIAESNEPLVDLRKQSEIAVGESPWDMSDNMDYTKLRKSVYEKLVQAQNSLPAGLKFCVFEGYRNPKLQEKLFDNKYREIQTQNPDWDHEQIFWETTKFVSPIINLDGTNNIPPHCTGAAVDVYLVEQNGVIVDMGIKPGDPFTDGDIIRTHSSTISSTAQHNRDIMAQALREVGFVNYPTEYWHWSYGDRYWAYHTEAAKAIYGMVTD